MNNLGDKNYKILIKTNKNKLLYNIYIYITNKINYYVCDTNYLIK